MKLAPPLAAPLLGALVGACSAMGLGEHELFECDPGDPTACDHLNEPGVCPRFYCHDEGGCAQTSVGSELCDSIDNDCDGVIDEGVVPSAHNAGESFEAKVRRVSYGGDVEGIAHATVTHEMVKDGRLRTTVLTLSEDSVRDRELLPTEDCTAPQADVACQLDDIALAASPDLVLGAGFVRAPCRPGQLRVGLGSTNPFELRLGDAAVTAGTAAIVDIDGASAGQCSFSTSGCRGGERPSVALLALPGGQPAHGLIAWLVRADPEQPTCEASNGQVAAVAVSIEGRGSQALLGSPKPQTSTLLSERPATGWPVVVAVSPHDERPAGFLIALPSGDKVEVAFVIAPASPENIELATRLDLPAPGATEVAIATGHDGGRGAAVAYRTALDGAAVRLAILALPHGEQPLRLQGARPLNLEAAEHGSGLALSYTPVGLSNAEDALGGWLIAWIAAAEDSNGRANRLMVTRVAESRLHEPGPAAVFATGASEPFAYVKQRGDHSTTMGLGYRKLETVHFARASCDR